MKKQASVKYTIKDRSKAYMDFINKWNDLQTYCKTKYAEDGYLAHNKATNLWIDWYNHTYAYIDQIVKPHLAYPERLSKKMDGLLRLFNRSRSPKNVPGYIKTNKRKIDLLVGSDAWKLRSETSGATFQLGGFTVHNTINAKDELLENAKKMIKIAYLKKSSTGLPGFPQMYYGDLFIVGNIGRPNWLAWYTPSKDIISIRPEARGSLQGPHNLIHEIGHRWWQKKATREQTRAWQRYHYSVLRSKGSVEAGKAELERIIKSKEPQDFSMLVQKPGKKRKTRQKFKVRYDRDVRGALIFVDIATDEMLATLYESRVIEMLQEKMGGGKWPTAYSKEDPEEHFCECVALKALGTLKADALAHFNKIFLGQDMPRLASFYETPQVSIVANRFARKQISVQRVLSRFQQKQETIQRVAAKFQEKKQVDKADGSGKTTVYVYSEGQVAHRHREKAKRLEKLRNNISTLREQIKKDLKSDDPKTKLTALAVAMIDETCERPGNEESVKEREHYGITTLEMQHISFKGSKAVLSYTGKSGVKHTKEIANAEVVKLLKEVTKGKDKDERILCQGEDCKILASDVNSYLKEHDITAKDIRGLHANEEMKKQLKKVRKEGPKLSDDKKEKEAQLKEEFNQALEHTAEYVGHEAATLKGQYLVPGLEDDFLKDGTVTEKMTKSKKASVPEKYKHINFTPPDGVANAAAKGLEYRQKASPSNRGGLTNSEAAKEGIGSGVQRAVNLKNKTNVSPKVIKQMSAFFARHEKNKGVKPENKGKPYNDKGHVAWLLWGGDPGKAWCNKVKGQMEAADEKEKQSKKAFVTKGKPANFDLWMYVTQLAKDKFARTSDSVYVVAWAVQKYKEMGGTWIRPPKIADLNPQLGWPGGVCHVVDRIDKEVRNPRLKDHLIDKMESGDKLTNPEANKVYDMTVEKGVNKLIKRISITPHAQFRMDQRNITVPDIRAALMHWSKDYYDSKSKRGYFFKEWDKQIFRGEAIRYTAKKIGRLTVVFNIVQGTAIIVTCFWEGLSDPKPTGTCEVR